MSQQQMKEKEKKNYFDISLSYIPNEIKAKFTFTLLFLNHGSLIISKEHEGESLW